MSKTTKLLAALAFVPLTFAAASASAQEAPLCAAEFDALSYAILADGTGLSAKDRDGMNLKAQLAEVKLAEGKIGDSLQKLDDIQLKIDQLAAAPKQKIKDWAVESITNAVTAAGTCVYNSTM